MFLLFSKLQNIECKNKIDFSFSPICSTDCTLQSGILNSTCKNRDIRLVSSRWVTLMQQLNKTKYIESKMTVSKIQIQLKNMLFGPSELIYKAVEIMDTSLQDVFSKRILCKCKSI